MRVLLDTHALLWWLDGDARLSPAAFDAINDRRNEINVSAASAWEIATKVRLGKLPGAVQVAEQFSEFLEEQGFETLDITPEHAIEAGRMPGVHRDPFDRILVAQAKLEGMILISNEAIFQQFGVERLW